MAITSLISNIISIGSAIAQQINQAQINKTQCTRLSQRIAVITATLKGINLPTAPAQVEHYEKALLRLEKTLKDSLSIVEKHTNRKRLKKFLMVKAHKDQFQLIYDRLGEDIVQLNLGLNVEQLLNQQEDRLDREKDRKFIESNLLEISGLVMSGNKYLENFSEDEALHHEITQQKLHSIMAFLKRNFGLSNQPATFNEKKTNIDLAKLDIQEKIAVGSLGVVFKGLWREQLVAIKRIDRLGSSSLEEEFVREVKILRSIRSPNIVALYGASLEESPDGSFKSGYLVMTYMAKGSLWDYCESHYPTAEQYYQWALEIALGLHYLHVEGLIHRNLNPKTILLDNDGHAKLAGLGLAKVKSGNVRTAGRSSSYTEWLPPELLAGKDADVKSDIYSYACILYWLLTRETPYKGTDLEKLRKIEHGFRPKIPVAIDETYSKIIENSWKQDVEDRGSAKKIIESLRQNERLRSTLFSESAEQNYARAKQLKDSGDNISAVRSYKLGAKQGDWRAKTSLGIFHAIGAGGLSRSSERANSLFQEAAKRGHVRAMVNLWKQYEKGAGVERNMEQALYWLKAAAKQGDQESRDYYPSMQRKVDAISTEHRFN